MAVLAEDKPMKFMVTRTSFHLDSQQPCDEAARGTYVRIDTRTTNDPAKIHTYKGKDTSWWYESGRNHRVERGHIKRDFDAEGWFIEIATLEDLAAFTDKYGTIVIGWAFDNRDIRSIEIYDGYRE